MPQVFCTCCSLCLKVILQNPCTMSPSFPDHRPQFSHLQSLLILTQHCSTHSCMPAGPFPASARQQLPGRHGQTLPHSPLHPQCLQQCLGHSPCSTVWRPRKGPKLQFKPKACAEEVPLPWERPSCVLSRRTVDQMRPSCSVEAICFTQSPLISR